jgi:hypothetical protein
MQAEKSRRKEELYGIDRNARLHVALIMPAQKTIPAVMQSIFVRCKTRLPIVVLAVLVSAMAGCGNSSIVGKWRMSGAENQTVWEFSNNGSVLVGEVRGRYKFGNQNRIKIETPFATTVFQLEISGDRMILRELGGSKLEFTRVTETRH